MTVAFLIPAFFIAIGSFIAVPFGYRSFRWSGIPILVTGLAVLITAVLPKLILKGTAGLVTWIGTQQCESVYWPPDLIREMSDQVYNLVLVVIDPLFSPVMSTALFVALFGVVLYAVSFISDRSVSDPYEPVILPGKRPDDPRN